MFLSDPGIPGVRSMGPSLSKGVIQKTKTGKIASKKHNRGGWGGVSDAKKTQLFPQKVILLATI